MRMSGAQKFNRADGCDAKTYTWQMQVPATPKMAILLYHRRAPRARNLRHLRRRFGRHRV